MSISNGLDRLSVDQIGARVAAADYRSPMERIPENLFGRPRRRAGVLIPFTRIRNAWHLLFIRRSEHEDDHHGGQVAFPGGGKEPGDADIVQTALREAHEEVGLLPDDVQVIGSLQDVVSITNYQVTPVVGVFDSPYPFKQDWNEVARIFSIPLTWLADPVNLRVETREIPGQGTWPVTYFEHYDGELLWGFTAGLVRQLLAAIGE